MADNDKTIGGRRSSVNTDPHATGKAGRDTDPHATGKAGRDTDPHATGKAGRDTDEHATGKGSRAQSRGSDNLRPFEQKNNDLRNISNQANTSTGLEWPDFFVLEGIKYKNEGVLSDSSGEAIIFTVSNGGNKYALKIYYYDPLHRPNHAVLEKIRQLGGSGLLVSIVSHGEWDNPNGSGQKLDYELMDFCEGGSLDGVIITDENKLSEVAVKMGAAIDFLAKHGILHRDIKPANFFFADKEQTQIVLADFGISMECPQGGFIKIDEMRSPVYAAPEFYTNVPGEPAEVGVESDFFSLGVALLCLWMGKAQLTANESQLLKYKLNETLPMPKDMSPHMTSLLKALTRLKMSDRANFDDIKRWVKGEILDSGDGSNIHSNFHIIFNSGKNQIANSPAELARLLLDDDVLGKKYLYSGRVTRWLEETGCNEIAVNVEDIVEKVYPSNQNAGLMSVAFMLDPSMDYVDPEGNHHSDPKELALTIVNKNYMAAEVVNPDSNLMIYLTALKLDKTVATIRDYVRSDDYDFDSKTINDFIASFYLGVLLDPTLPCPLSVEDGWQGVYDVDEMMEVFRTEGDVDLINKGIVCSPAFIVWLAARNPALAGKIRMLHDNADYEDPSSIYYISDFPYRIVYELMPEADYNFSTDLNDPDRIYTIKDIGEYLNKRLDMFVKGEDDEESFERLFIKMDSHPIGQYLRARGEEYAKFLNWNRYCMNVDEDENAQKAGPYDAVIGAYKSVAGFLGEAPTYPLGKRVLKSLDDVKRVPKKELAAAMSGKERVMPVEGKTTPWLDAWITLFFQENPRLDLSETFTYEKETAKYVETIADIDPKNYYAQRYNKAINRIDDAAARLRRSDHRVKGKRLFFLILAGLPTLIMLSASWFLDMPDGNPIKGHIMKTFIICAVATFIAFMTLADFGAAIIPGLIGGAVCTALAYIGFQWFPSLLYIIGAGVLIVAAVIAIRALFMRNKVDTGGVEIRGNEFEFRQLDALYYAYRQDDDNIDNAVTDYSTLQRDEDKTTRDNIGFTGWIWTPLVWMIFLLWFFATPQISRHLAWVSGVASESAISGSWVLGKWDARYTGGSTRIVCNIDSVENGNTIYGTMVIAGQAPVKATGFVYSDGNKPKSFTFWVESGDSRRQKITADYNEQKKTMTGHYYDRKTVMHDVTFTSTPLGNEAAPAKPKQEASSKNNAPKTSKDVETKAEKKSTTILPELPGFELSDDENNTVPQSAPAESTPEPQQAEVTQQEPQQTVQSEPQAQPEPQKVPDSKATRQKFRAPGS